MRQHGYLAFVVGLCLTAAVCLSVFQSQQRQARASFQRDVDKVARDTGIRLQTYFDALLGIKGMYAVNDRVARPQFVRFVRELQLAQRYPGFQAIQFVRAVPAAGLDAFIAGLGRADGQGGDGFPPFQLHPAGARPVHYIIELTEPVKGNEIAYGLDLAAFPQHLLALEMGRDSGQIVATERVTLVQDRSGAAGFVARAPVYRHGAPLATVDQRRAALDGFVAIVFRVNTLMREVVDPRLLDNLKVRIHDRGFLRDGGAAAPEPRNLLFDSAAAAGAAGPAALPGLHASVNLEVGQRRWQIDFDGLDGARYSQKQSTVLFIAVAGAVISALVAALLMAWRRRQELAVQLSQTLEEQRALQDSASVGIGQFSDGSIVRCNRGLEEMMGYAVGALEGRPSRVLVGPDGEGDPFDPFALAPGEAGERRELELRRQDGSPVWCMINGRRLDAAPGAGAVCASVWVISDISERKQAEAQLLEARSGLERNLAEMAAQKCAVEQAHAELSRALATLQLAQTNLITSEKMASLGALVAGIAHELNTPIGNSLLTATALNDMVDRFERKLEGPAGMRRSELAAHLADTRQACSIMTGSLLRAAELITSFKQVAVDQASGQRRPFKLADVLRDTLATFAAQLRRANCQVRFEVPEELDFDSYPGSVGQVLSNLINNAMLHAFEGRAGGTIRITARRAGDSVELEFSDDGVGMSARTLNQIYDPFFTTKMGQGGSGLGMNIVYNIVTGVLKGTIRIESELGVGTRVMLSLPLCVGEPALPAAPAAPARA